MNPQVNPKPENTIVDPADAAVCLLVSELDAGPGRSPRLDRPDTRIAQRHRELMRAAASRHGGHAMACEGPRELATFTQAAAAIGAALDLQFAMDAERWPEPAGYAASIGIHLGMAQRLGDRYIAPAVRQAIRIARTAHGGQVLLSSEAMAEAGTPPMRGCSFRDLGALSLREFATSIHLYQLCYPGLRSHFPPPRAAPAARYRLTPPPTSFVGRGSELASLTMALQQHRRVNLVGAAGVGKTRLTLEAGEALLREYADGVWYVDLAHAIDAESATESCATVLGLADTLPGAADDTLPSQLESWHAVVILDHGDALPAATSRLAARLATAPELRVLTVTRTPLHGAGERRLSLDALACHGHSGEVSPAAQLLIERLQRHGSVAQQIRGYDVNRLASQLAGLPLALEWVAGQGARSSLAELSQALCGRTDAADPAARIDGAQRRDLSAVFQWTFARLSPEEQRLLQGLAVFARDWDGTGALAVAADPDATPDRVARDLSSLIELGLVVRTQLHGVERDSLAPALRERLLASLRPAQREALYERLVRWAVECAQAPAPTPEQCANRRTGWRLEYDNLRAAAEFACRAGHPLVAPLAAAMMTVSTTLNARREALRWGERAEPMTAADPHLRARVLIELGHLLRDAQPQRAEDGLREGLALAARCADAPLQLDALQQLTVAARKRNESSMVEALLMQRIGLLEVHHDPLARFRAQVELGTLMLEQNRQEQGIDHLREQLQEAGAQGWQRDAALLAEPLALALIGLGSYREALPLAERGAAELRRLGSLEEVAQLLCAAALALLCQGEATQARRYFVEVGRLALEAGADAAAPRALEGLAALDAAAGRIEPAARYVYAADSLRHAAGHVRSGVDLTLRTDIGRRLRAELDAQTLGRLQAESMLQARHILAQAIGASPT